MAGERPPVAEMEVFFREMMSSFSLEIRTIRPFAVFGTKRRTALRREGFARVPDLGSFLKLLEVGGFSLLGFYTLFKGFSMFRFV